MKGVETPELGGVIVHVVFARILSKARRSRSSRVEWRGYSPGSAGGVGVDGGVSGYGCEIPTSWHLGGSTGEGMAW